MPIDDVREKVGKHNFLDKKFGKIVPFMTLNLFLKSFLKEPRPLGTSYTSFKNSIF